MAWPVFESQMEANATFPFWAPLNVAPAATGYEMPAVIATIPIRPIILDRPVHEIIPSPNNSVPAK